MSIEFKNIKKALGGREVIREMSFPCGAGETTALLGMSGCGKTTLLRMVIGLILPDHGHIFVNQAEVQTSNLKDIRKKIGYVIQGGGLYPHLSARENISIAAKQNGWDKSRIHARLDELCDLSRLSPQHIGRKPQELSGGQRQRVALMRALFMDPEFLLMDEPLGALDPLVRYELQNDLSELFRTLKKTVLWVTHDLSEAARLSHKMIILNEGTTAQLGSPVDVLKNPKAGFVSDFVKSQQGPLDVLANV